MTTMTTTQPPAAAADLPEALRLAAWLNEGAWNKMRLGDVLAAGNELRRQHAENERLRAALGATEEQEFYAVIAPCGEGVIFNDRTDARWTLTGRGAGSDGFGVPVIADAFREAYGTENLRMVKVRIVGGAA